MRYVIALLVGILIVIGLHWYALHIVAEAEVWAATGQVLSLGDRIAMGFAAFWRPFGWVFSPVIVVLCLGAAALGHRRPKASAQAAK